jgi:hypothetical protein
MQPDETILWTGHPDPSRWLSSNDLILVPFSLLWGGFAIFWFVGASSVDAVFSLFGVPFVLIGQYFIWGRFFYKRWDRGRMLYGLTNQRALILHGSSMQSMFVQQLSSVNQSMRADGSGTLDFGGLAPGYAFWANSGMDFFMRGRTSFAFYDIPDVAQVYRLVSDARTAKS